ncbi:hypothetical protein P4S72_04620 [Vibrio sp. PP-XX7]
MDKLFDYLAQDESIWNQLLTPAHLHYNAPSRQSLKQMITTALPIESIWDWREGRDYFSEAEGLVKRVLEAAKSLDELADEYLSRTMISEAHKYETLDV